MNKEIGKWFLDVAKYIVTAYILTNMFVKIDTFVSALGAIVVMVVLFGREFSFWRKIKKKVIIRIINGRYIMNWGLFSMYVALMLLGVGMIIYSRIDDKREKKNQWLDSFSPS